MNPTIINYVNKSLDFVARHKAYLMYEAETVPPAMAVPFDAALLAGKSPKLIIEHPEGEGEIIELMKPGEQLWQAVESTVTDADIAAIEERYNINLPDSYKEYLKYKHFYTIFFNPDIKLYPNPVEKWRDILCENNDEMRDELLEQGYFAIGEYSDYGVICFALKDDNSDCPVVMIDHSYGVPDEDEEENELGENFIDFLDNILAQGEGTVRELKDWEKRIHNKN